MKIERIESPKGDFYGYFVTGSAGTVVIDPVNIATAKEAKKRELTVQYVLMTHCYFDNACGCSALRRMGAKVGCLNRECSAAAAMNIARKVYDLKNPRLDIDFIFSDKDVLSYCGLEIKVIATPGVSAGSCCFYIKDHGEAALFTGHTLYKGGSDLQTRPAEMRISLMNSFSALFELEDCTVYPARGETTTVLEEKNGFKL